MKKRLKFFSEKIMLISFLAVLFGSTIYAIGLHFFVAPIGSYAGGVTGLSQVLIELLNKLHIPTLSLGILTILFNIPIMIFGWFKVEKRFVILSIFAVLYIGILLNFFDTIPIKQFSDALLVNILFGGLLLGAGSGIALRYGGSLGGIDILLAYLSYKRGNSIGNYSIIVNIIIVLCAFLLNPDNIEGSLITIILFFYIGLVVNQVHTKHRRFTAFIVSTKPHILIKQIHIRCGRGATLIKAEGTFEKADKPVIMTVVSSYQLYALKNIIITYDPRAFVNIVPTKEVYGNFISQKNELPLEQSL